MMCSFELGDELLCYLPNISDIVSSKSSYLFTTGLEIYGMLPIKRIQKIIFQEVKIQVQV